MVSGDRADTAAGETLFIQLVGFVFDPEVSFHLHCNRESVDPAAVGTFLPLTCYVGLISVISDLEETWNMCVRACVCVFVCIQLQLTVVAEVVHKNDLMYEMYWSSV